MSFGEIIVIIFIAVLLFGPDKIPEIARGLGQGVRAMKDATDNIKREVMSQIEENDSLKEIEDEIQEAKKNIKDSVNEDSNNITSAFDDTFEGPVKRS
ncbi:Sec-independent protein translocase subunit TatA/TatB [Apibacter adventoris]|uniref:Sec-independent protein translocase subunit TatA/TatB n=1 Tax=Apibacter adventoris TaxID=1679466 RepID=UPI0026B1E684|nr:twin-arginine translocase TatA/TatE family subunit [Apibacter adventoris]